MLNELGPFPKAPTYSKILGGILLVSYILLTVWFWGNLDAEMFARMGSFGVAAVAIAYAVNRKESQWFEASVADYEKAVVSGTLAGLSADERQKLDAKFAKERRAIERFKYNEIFFLVVATLQWGFGDLAVNIARCGDRPC